MKCGEAISNEFRKAVGGKAGDQSGSEVLIRDWKYFGQTAVYRFKSYTLALKYAELIKAACNNPNIGYSQEKRTTLYTQAKKVNFDISKITTPCECDCSSLVACCLIGVGVDVISYFYTGNMGTYLDKTGLFKKYTSEEYTKSDKRLHIGDILVKPNYHVATVVAETPKVKPAREKDTKLAGTYTATTDLNMRYGAGKENEIVTILKAGDKVKNYGFYTTYNGIKWLLVTDGKNTGYCSSKYLTNE